MATSIGKIEVPRGLGQARGTLPWSLCREPCPHLDRRFLTPELEENEFVLKLSSLWPVAAAAPGH